MCEFCFECPADLLVEEPGFAQLVDKISKFPARRLHPVCQGLCPSFNANEGSRTLPQFQQAFVFKFGIGFCNSVRTDDQFLGESSNARQLVAVEQGAGFCSVPNLLHQLQIERLSRRGGEFEEERHELY